jgi:hypothetical protein
MLSKIKNQRLKTIMFRQKYDVDAVNFSSNWASKVRNILQSAGFNKV